jgi:hypothetical protein
MYLQFKTIPNLSTFNNLIELEIMNHIDEITINDNVLPPNLQELKCDSIILKNFSSLENLLKKIKKINIIKSIKFREV